MPKKKQDRWGLLTSSRVTTGNLNVKGINVFLAKVNGIIKPEVQLSCLIYNAGLVMSELIYTIT